MRPHRPITFRRAASAVAATITCAVIGAALVPPAVAAEPPAAVTAAAVDAAHDLVTAVTSNFANAGTTEDIEKLRDRDGSTKWYARNSGQPTTANPVYAIYTLSAPTTVTGYTITSANDSQERDPSAWTLLGTNDAAAVSNAASSSWVAVDSRSGETFAGRFQRNTYAAKSAASYAYYQLRVTGNRANSATADNNKKLQLADWTLLGTANATRLVGPGTTWRYWENADPADATTDPAGGASDRTAWSEPGFALGSGWKSASASFGAKAGTVGPLDGGYTATTLLKHYLSGTSAPVVPSYFFRTDISLTATDVSSIAGLYGGIVYDDTATVYVNGARVTGWNDASVTSNTAQLSFSGATDPARQLFFVPASMLRAGVNTVAVEIHQCNATSSDVYFDMPFLTAASDYLSLPFTPSELGASYSSDSVGTAPDGSDYFTYLLNGFADLRANHPEIVADNAVLPAGTTPVAANDLGVIAVNNAAANDPAKLSQALTDADGSPYVTMADGLGNVLGPLYSAALKAGELPKTTAILGGMAEKGRDHEPAKAAYSYKRPYNRLGYTSGGNCDSTFVGTGRIVKSSNGSYSGLCTNGSFPSGHSNHGYVQGTTLATLLPELAPQILLRTSEYGNNRLVLGFHYPLDVMGGRIAGQNTVQQRWSDPAFRDLLEQAQAELESVLGAACRAAGHSGDVETCAQGDGSLPTDAQAVQTYTNRLTYGFPATYATGVAEIVPDGASDLLLTTFPELTAAQRASVLRMTAIDSGFALDKTRNGQASWQRIDLAAAMTAVVTFGDDGAMFVDGEPVDGPHALPAITLGAASVVAGASIDVHGTGFAAGEVVTVSVTSGPDTIASGVATATGAGALSSTIAIPAGTAAGTYDVTAVGSVSAAPATAALEVTAAPHVWTPSLTAPAGVQVGEAVVVTGGGFAPDEQVTVTFGASSTTVPATPTGGFETSFLAPGEPGTYTARALGATSAVPATVDVVVTARPVVYEPSISAPAAVGAGEPVEVSGSGFAPHETVALRLGAASQEAVATATGDFVAVLVAPDVAGSYVLTATGSVSAKPVTASVVVTTAPVVWAPVVHAPASATVGRSIALSGSGFAPGEQVTITFGSLVTGLRASSEGTFTVQLPVPTANGVYVVTATGETSRTPSTSSVSVTGAPTVYDPRVSAPATVAFGSPFTVSGTGFAAGEHVAVSVGATHVTVTASTAGAVSAVVRERLAVGNHTVSVRGSVSALTRTTTVAVVKAAAKVTLAASTTATGYGRKVTLRATIAPSAATGAVQFYDGFRKLGGRVTVSGGVARTTVTTLAVGPHKVRAAYLGSGSYAGATSSTVTIRVVKAKVSSVKVSGKAFVRGSRPVVTVRVGALDSGARAAGKVSITVGGTKVVTVSLKASQTSVTVRLPRAYSSSVRVKATFTPTSTATVASASSSTVTIRTR